MTKRIWACFKQVLVIVLTMNRSSNGFYLRSNMARTVYHRLQADSHMQQFDKTTWYRVEKQVLSAVLLNTFLQFHLDNTTQLFLDNCHEKADWLFTQIFHSLASTFLGLFMTKTSINGWLSRGSMFVMSAKQFESLLGIEESWKGENFLDIGAGDGKVTQILAPHFHRTSVTEASPVMRTILANKNYSVLEICSWMEGETKYDLISCLNVLDRCVTPLTLLKDMKSKIKPDGYLLLALVVPFHPYVEFGANNSHKPTETMHISGETFEQQVNSLYASVLEPLDLEVVRWTKLPYLCEGNLQQSYYWLTDVLFLLKIKSNADSCGVVESQQETRTRQSICNKIEIEIEN